VISLVQVYLKLVHCGEIVFFQVYLVMVVSKVKTQKIIEIIVDKIKKISQMNKIIELIIKKKNKIIKIHKIIMNQIKSRNIKRTLIKIQKNKENLLNQIILILNVY